MDRPSEVVEAFFDSFNDLLLAFLGVLVYLLVDGLLVLGQEGSHGLVVNQAGHSGLRVQQDYGQDDAEGHVGESVEEQL